MQDNHNNSLSKQKAKNSDLISLREDFAQFTKAFNSKLSNSFNKTFITKYSSNTLINFPKRINLKSKYNNLLINNNVDKDKNYNIKFNIEENSPKTPNFNNNLIIIKEKPNLKEKTIYKNDSYLRKKLNKSKTEINFFSGKHSFENIKNIKNLKDFNNAIFNFQNLSDMSNNSHNKKIKINNSNLNKTYFSGSSKNNTIYYNSSLDNFYIKNKKRNIKTITLLNKLNRNKFFLLSPKSYSVNLITNIMNIFNKDKESKNCLSKEKDNNKIGKNNDINEENKEKNIFNSTDKGTFSHYSLKSLFQKNTPKVKNGVLNDIMVDNNIDNNDILLNPFSNSYGVVLNILSEKVGFMKGSMDIIYPKITQKKYQIRALERKKEFNFKRSSSQENSKKQNSKNNSLFNIKSKKIIQSIYSKYPINIKRSGNNIFSSKMYSFKGKKI